MHLLFVVDSLGSGGAQRQMVILARGLAASGHQVEFFIYHPQYRHLRSAVDEAGITVHSYRKGARFSPAVIVALRRLIKIGGFDVVVSFLDTPNAYAEIASLGLRNRPALVVSERSSFSGKTPGLGARLLRYGHRLADFIVVNSHHHRRHLAEIFPWMVPRMMTIINGVPIAPVPMQCAPQSGADAVALLAVGNIVHNKNVVGLVKALHLFNQRHNNRIRIRWAGKRLHSAAGERAYLEACHLIQSLGVSHLWEWLGERSDIEVLMSKHDALIHPSFYEGTPNVICEALASGLPVLASDVCDHGTLVQDGITGFLFNPHDPSSIATVLERFVKLTAAERTTAGARAREFAHRVLDTGRYVREYEALLADLTFGRQATNRGVGAH